MLAWLSQARDSDLAEPAGYHALGPITAWGVGKLTNRN